MYMPIVFLSYGIGVGRSYINAVGYVLLEKRLQNENSKGFI